MSEPHSGTILIVDDSPDIRAIVAGLVQGLGLATLEAGDGAAGLVLARSARPDLILLDIKMPVLDGRATLAALKQDQELREIPVIVLSGLGDTAVAVECIQAGADDYVDKPFQATLLLARVSSSLEKGRLRIQAQAYLEHLHSHSLELEERVLARTRDLAAAHERLGLLDQAKDEFLRLIAHEVRTPATGVLAAAEALADPEQRDGMTAEWVDLLRVSVDRLLRIVEDSLLLTTINASGEGFVLAPHALAEIAEQATVRAGRVALGRQVRIEGLRGDYGLVLCEKTLLQDALASLLECAVKFSTPDQAVRMSCRRTGDVLELRMQAHGHTIPAHVVPKFFEVFSMTEAITPGNDLGLGPPVAARVLQLLGGSVSVDATEGGVAFLVRLRAAA